MSKDIKTIGPSRLLDKISETNPRDIFAIWRTAEGKWKRGRYVTDGLIAADIIGQMECFKIDLHNSSESIDDDS